MPERDLSDNSKVRVPLCFLIPALWMLALLSCHTPTPPQSGQPVARENSGTMALVHETVNNATASALWQPPRSAERLEERLSMVSTQIEARQVSNPKVLAAMRQVPRHWFVPESHQRDAYADHPLPIGQGQTISQPYIVALMTEALTLEPEDKVLEVGTGSGYQAAVLSEVTPHVWTIEIDEILATQAARTLRERGYQVVQCRCGDGYAGWPEAGPFDAVIVTCAPSRIPQPLIDQLALGGRMCIPVGENDEVQELVLVIKQPNGSLQTTRLELVRFVPMTGQSQQTR